MTATQTDRQAGRAEERGMERRKGSREETGVNVGGAERWASILGGAALVAAGLSRRSIPGAALAALGGVMVQRGATGHCMMYEQLGITSADATELSTPFTRAITARKSVTINRSPHDVYRFWRELTNLPMVMTHLKSVAVVSPTRSHWVGAGPGDQSYEWDADIIDDREGERLAWRTLPGSDLEHAGWVEFRPAPADRGTRVTLEFRFRPPMGAIGAAVAKMTHLHPREQVVRGLRRLKQIMETGQITSAQGPSCRKPAGRGGVVERASEQSFPASDAPGWNPGRV